MSVFEVGVILIVWTAVTVGVGWFGVRWAARDGWRRAVGIVAVALGGFFNPIVNLPVGFVVREMMVAERLPEEGVTTADIDAQFGAPVATVAADGPRLAQRRHAIGPWFALWPTELVADVDDEGRVRSVWLD